MLIGVREKVRLLRYQQPGATLQEIGTQTGVCRERVRQILKSENLPTLHYHARNHCKICGKRIPLRRIHCGGRCYHKDHTITLECSICHWPFTILQSIYKDRLRKRKGKDWYCSKTCFGVWLSKNNKKFN